MTEISSSDISVVVQGPVSGKPGDPKEQRLTLRCLESVRLHFPEAEGRLRRAARRAFPFK